VTQRRCGNSCIAWQSAVEAHAAGSMAHPTLVDRAAPSGRSFFADLGGKAVWQEFFFDDLDAELANALDEQHASIPPETTTDMREDAAADIEGIRRFLRHRARKRRGTPPWSVPTEVWHMLLWPNLRRQKVRSIGGEGFSLRGDRFWKRLGEAMVHMRRVSLTPMKWNVARAWDIAKPGAAGRRLGHGFCPFGKAWAAVAAAMGCESIYAAACDSAWVRAWTPKGGRAHCPAGGLLAAAPTWHQPHLRRQRRDERLYLHPDALPRGDHPPAI